MRDVVRALREMLSISWHADAARSIAALVTASGQMVAPPLRAIGLKVIVDGILAHDGRRALTGTLLVVGFGTVGRLMTWASFNVRMRLRENTQLHLDSRLMALTAGIPGLEHHERPDYLDKLELLVRERGALANPFNPISWSVASLVQTVSVLWLLAAIHPALALLPVFGVPSLLATVCAERAEVRLREAQAEPNRLRRHLFELATQAPAGKEVRVFGLAGELLRRRRALFEDLERASVSHDLRKAVITAAGWSVFALGYAGAVAFAVHQVLGGHASVGAVVLVLTLGAQLNQQIAELTENLAWMVRTHRSVGRLLWLLDYARTSHDGLKPARPAPVPARLESGIRFEAVSFSYPGMAAPVLRDVDLVLPAGRTIAVVGENGAGKTTLVKLLCRFYEPTGGSITVDGIHLRDLALEDWRRAVSAGFQDFARFTLLARQSIGVGDTARVGSDRDLLAALDRAAASDLLAALPRAFDTQLGRDFDGGVELSLGQWQKAALARAMMRPFPLVLVLDEPTASLDAATEHALFERFAGAAREAATRAGAITILISHRFSTVRMADLILVVADGRIAEAGDHETLVRNGGLYARLYELQARAYR